MSEPRIIPVQPARSEPTAPGPFDRIAVVGFGLIGGSIGLAAKRRWPASLVIAVDRKDVIEAAMRASAADVGGDDLGLAGDAELIVLAAPVRENIRLLEALPEYVPAAATVSDAGSTKREIVRAARGLPPRLSFVGGHPLAGAAVSGLEHARADLFEGRPWLITSDAQTDDEVVSRLERFVAGLGAVPRRMGADDHDRLLAYLSHLPQLVISGLMHTVGSSAGDSLALAGRGLRDTTRLATSPAGTWRDILASNSDYVSEALDALIDTLDAMRQSSRGDGAAIAEVFESAARWKRALDG